jgi:hypothetical protein
MAVGVGGSTRIVAVAQGGVMYLPSADQLAVLIEAAKLTGQMIRTREETCRAMVKLGRILSDVRESVPHGQWHALLCRHRIHVRTAQRALEVMQGVRRHGINADTFTNFSALKTAVRNAEAAAKRDNSAHMTAEGGGRGKHDNRAHLTEDGNGWARDERVNGPGKRDNRAHLADLDDEEDDDGEDFADEDFGIEPGEETGITAEEEDAIFGGAASPRTLHMAQGHMAQQEGEGPSGEGRGVSEKHSTYPSSPRLSTVPSSPSALGPRASALPVSQLTFDGLYAAAEQARAAVLAIDVRGLGDEAAVRGFTSELAALAAKWGKKTSGSGCGVGDAGGGREPVGNGEHTG